MEVELLFLFHLNVSLWLLKGITVLEYYIWKKFSLHTICIIGLVDSLITGLVILFNGNQNN